jgi:uncharacterized cupin superfamily protein
MHKINIATPEFAYDAEDPEGFRAGMLRLGKELGASRTGTSLYELPPGQSICPYHYEYPEEEWLIVLSGRPMLRHPEGVEQLEPWDIVFFPPGPDGAHAVRNDTAETVHVLMYSTVSYPAVSVYPDSDKVGVWVGDPEQDVLLPRSAAVAYYHGEE